MNLLSAILVGNLPDKLQVAYSSRKDINDIIKII